MPARNTQAQSMSIARHMVFTSRVPHAMGAWLMLAWLPVAMLSMSMVQAEAPATNQHDALPRFERSVAPDEAAWVDLSHAQLVHAAIEGWLSQGDASTTVAPIWASDIAGVKVTLRLSGWTLASAEVWVEPIALRLDPRDTLGRPVVDLAQLAQQATTHTITQLADRIANPLHSINGDSTAHHRTNHTTSPAHPAPPVLLDPLAPVKTTPSAATDPPQSSNHNSTMTTPALTKEQVQERLRHLGPRVLVDLQIAKRPRPVLIPATDPESAVVFAFIPGHHGLILTAAQHGSTSSAKLWPATALADNLSPLQQLHHLLGQLNLSETQLKRIARPLAATTTGTTNNPATNTTQPPDASTLGQPSLQLSRFEIIHLVRPSWNDPPMAMVRGQPLLPTAPLTSPTLQSLAERMTPFLLRRINADGQSLGVYQPTTDRLETEVATWPETALLAYTLAQRLQYLQQTQADPASIQPLQNALQRLLSFLQPTDGSPAPGIGPAQRDPAATALFILTLHTLRDDPAYQTWHQYLPTMIDRLRGLRLAEGGFAQQFISRNQPANLPLQGLILAALSTHAAVTGDVELQKLVADELDRCWKQTAPGPLATAMPWLAVAEFALREPINARDGSTRLGSLKEERTQRLLALAKTLRAQLIRQPPVGSFGISPPADVVGGFDVMPRSPESHPYPDWRGSQFLAFWAIALAQPEFRQGPDVLPWLLDCGLAARFMAQLMFTETGTFAVRNPDEVLGGVRLAPWDNRVGTPATAMGLLAVTHLQQALHQLQQLQP